jgi:hypothetical protein
MPDGIESALSVKAAAARLGLSEYGLRKIIDRGELRPVTTNPVKLLPDDIAALRQRRQDAAIARLGVDRLAKVARDVRAQLHPLVSSGAPRGHDALELIPEVTKSAFTMPLLHGAAMPDGSGCRWCAAVVAGRMLRTSVSDALLASDVGMALLGDPVCEAHRGLLRGRMDALRASVHPGGAVRPSAARTEPVKAPGGAVASVAAPRAAVRPVGDDGGRELVGRRRREVQAALTAAKRRGDERHASQLRQQLRGLTADAARVDGRAVASRPGRLACGHLLAAGCACPRRASW